MSKAPCSRWWLSIRIPTLALAVAACGVPQPGTDESLGDRADEAASLPDSAAAAEQALPSGASPPRIADQAEQQDAGGGLPDPAQDPADSAMALTEIAAAQRLILARLDSIQGRTEEGTEPDSADIGVATLDDAAEGARDLGIKIFWSLVILVLFYSLIRVVIWVLETLAERSVTRRMTFKWLIPITRMLLWASAAYLIVLNVFRVDAQGIIAAGAALGVAVGIAAQDMLKNVLGGLTVVFDQPFQVGDKISVGGTYGEVVSIGLRSTRIVTADDDLVSIPNAQVVDEQVANSNAGQVYCQVTTTLHLSGLVDERTAKGIAFEAAVTSPYIFLTKPLTVAVEDDFRTTILTRLTVRAYVLDPRFEVAFKSDLTERAREGFRAAGLMPERGWTPWGREMEDSP